MGLRELRGLQAQETIEELSPETQGMVLEIKELAKIKLNGCGERMASEIALKLAILLGENKEE